MARILPTYVDRSCKSTGEKQMFDLLQRSSFTKDWVILHSLNLSQHSKRLYGEIDFLLLIPSGGVYVMEVKSGGVKCVDGVWYMTNRYGATNKSAVGPFNQARDAMFSLRSAIEKHFGKGHRFCNLLFGFFCCFPHISFDVNSVEHESWQILDRDGLAYSPELFFKNLIKNNKEKHKYQRWFSNSSLPTEADINELVQFLRGDFERIRTINDQLFEFDSRVKSYTAQQFRILDSIQSNERSIIQGSAGTGKTMLAIESAKRSASEGKRVFLTCYNRLIGEWMQKQLEGWSEQITVTSLHSYLISISKGFDYDSNKENKEDFFEKYLPSLVADIFIKGIIMPFDKIIIDEGQDLIREEYLLLFDAMLKNGLKNGLWEIYGDFEKQAIYSQLSSKEMIEIIKAKGSFSNFLLRINCRNTKQVGEETALLSGFSTPPFLLEYLEGIPVEYIFYNDEEHKKTLIDRYILNLVEQGMKPKDLVLLSKKKFQNTELPIIRGYDFRELKCCDDLTGIEPFFRFSTIQGFKGMESSYVVVTDVEELINEDEKCLLYVAMSRSRYGLALFINEAKRAQYREILKNRLT